MKKIATIGAGGFGREVKMLIDHINKESNEYEFIGYFDDGVIPNELVNGCPVLGEVNDLNDIDQDLQVVVAIGSPIVKKKILEKIINPFISFPVLIHPSVIVGNDNIYIGEGSIICAGSIITTDVSIGKHVILNLCCTVGHDTRINDFCSFMPSVNISGEVNIHECVYVGTGAKIINQLEVGTGTIIGAGAVVSRNLPPNCTAVGIPAKPIKFHNE